eukprot:TRINITY_DN26364_c0_g1_i1.p1 TRINITY_DN26364_c0_g1~~TRINITY_DN26364_c0_g1_i1.p1  ORF type:complete len:224 (+),score=44.03 TRINITY_DN26364_c0_g1_i1:37-672(+)
MAEKGILYACIAEEERILLQSSQPSSDYDQLVKVILERIPRHTNQQRAYLHGDYSYIYITDNGITYLCVTEVEFDSRAAGAFLVQVKDKYDGSMNFTAELKRLIHHYNTDPQAQKIKSLQAEVGKVKEITMENIENILRRGERLQDILASAEIAFSSAERFKQGSTELHSTMWWKNMKLNIAIGAAALAIIGVVFFFLLVIVCGGLRFPNC